MVQADGVAGAELLAVALVGLDGDRRVLLHEPGRDVAHRHAEHHLHLGLLAEREEAVEPREVVAAFGRLEPAPGELGDPDHVEGVLPHHREVDPPSLLRPVLGIVVDAEVHAPSSPTPSMDFPTLVAQGASRSGRDSLDRGRRCIVAHEPEPASARRARGRGQALRLHVRSAAPGPLEARGAGLRLEPQPRACPQGGREARHPVVHRPLAPGARDFARDRRGRGHPRLQRAGRPARGRARPERAARDADRAEARRGRRHHRVGPQAEAQDRSLGAVPPQAARADQAGADTRGRLWPRLLLVQRLLGPRLPRRERDAQLPRLRREARAGRRVGARLRPRPALVAHRRDERAAQGDAGARDGRVRRRPPRHLPLDQRGLRLSAPLVAQQPLPRGKGHGDQRRLTGSTSRRSSRSSPPTASSRSSSRSIASGSACDGGALVSIRATRRAGSSSSGRTPSAPRRRARTPSGTTTRSAWPAAS